MATAPHASTLVTFGIPLLALIALALIALAIRSAPSLGARHAAGFALGAGAFLAYSAALGFSGVLARFDGGAPPMLALVVPTLVLPLALGLSPLGAALARETPLPVLIGFHGFRLPLELVMHRAADEGTMPVQMTFTGANFDIVTGITAVIVALLAAGGRAPRGLLVAWNALGSLLLFAIVAIALASMPIFHAFGSAPERLNTWVAYFPFVWLPAGLVSSALFGHVLLFRRLHRRRAHGPSQSHRPHAIQACSQGAEG